jgi:hypothetical protein
MWTWVTRLVSSCSFIKSARSAAAVSATMTITHVLPHTWLGTTNAADDDAFRTTTGSVSPNDDSHQRFHVAHHVLDGNQHHGGGEFWLGVSVGGGSGFMVFLIVSWGFGVLVIGEGASRWEIFLIYEFGGVSGQ